MQSLDLNLVTTLSVKYEPVELRLGIEYALRMDKTKKLNRIIFLNKYGKEIKL